MSEASKLLWTARANAGLSQVELAEKAGIAVRTVTAIETGEITRPFASTAKALADALGIPVETLLPN